MNVITFFSLYGTPSTGLTPTIRIRNAVTNALVITDAAMTEIGDGFYKYDFSGYDNSIEYTIRCDGGVTLVGSERYPVAITSGYGELLLIKTQTDKMAFTVANQIDANVLTQANIDFSALQKTSLNAATPTALTANLAIVDAVVDAIKLKTDTINAAGTLIWTYTLTDSITGFPVSGAEIRLTTDSAGANTKRTSTTNSAGVATFYFDPTDSGLVVYVWSFPDGYNPLLMDQETVS
jgi:hypothetical protein